MNEEITLLFAVEAEQLLLSGFVEEAIDLLKKGIEKYPDYSAANAILTKAYSLLGIEESKQNKKNSKENKLEENLRGFDIENNFLRDSHISNGREINFEFEDTSEKLFSQESDEFDIDEFIKINSIKKEKKEFSIPFIEEEMKRIPSLVYPFKNFYYEPIKISYTEHLKYIDKIFNLEEEKKIIELHFLGKKLSSEPYVDEIFSISKESKEKSISNENFSFSSVTIAKIYQQQGAFKEAIAAYKELMISDPSKKEYYQDEINQMMES